MTGRPAKDSRPLSRLEWISTRWPQLGDTAHFCLRYGPAIRKYAAALTRDPHDADEVSQEFLVRVLERGFANADPARGRFRDYLKAAVRNAARTFLQRKRPRAQVDADVSEVAAGEESPSPSDQEWIGEWRQCLLDAAWRALEKQEHTSPGNFGYTVLRLSQAHPDEDSAALAARLATKGGSAMRPDAFRKQLSRARRAFAEHLAREVARTLEDAARERIEEELIEVGLFPFVRGFLPPDWTPQTDPGREA